MGVLDVGRPEAERGGLCDIERTIPHLCHKKGVLSRALVTVSTYLT